VVIHTVPRQARAESIFDKVRAVAARNNVSVHELSVQSHRGRLRVELHVELDETLSLLEAHNFVSAMEAEILRETPEIDAVLSHIESEPATIEQPDEVDAEDRKIEYAVQHAARLFPEILDVHEIKVGRNGEHIHVSCHCTLPDDLSMQKVHLVITGLEDRFRVECPEVYRMTIHPEPATDNLR
jgi:divalent metal cation (Fe/Co/Zn/Cd) transporter